jgi:hypothetical protein
MADDTQTILNTFQDYAKTFESLNPLAILPFYHYPALLISSNKVAALNHQLEGLIKLSFVMAELKFRGYDHARTEFLSVRQLGNNLAIVSGVVIRYKKDRHEKDDDELERFGLTYTLRKVDESWKIITGMLHDPVT